MIQKLLTMATLALALSLGAVAQTAREVLDATAARMTQSGAVRVGFRATQFQGTAPQNETTGTMLIDGRKFFMQTEDIKTWFDGKRQWSMATNASEVSLSEPTDEELAAMNLTAIVGIYKKGYAARLSTSTLRGKPTYVVRLTPTTAKAEFSDIFLDIERSTFTPLCIRAKQHGDWVRLAILSFDTKQKVKPSDFEFPKKTFPNVEVIDMR